MIRMTMTINPNVNTILLVVMTDVKVILERRVMKARRRIKNKPEATKHQRMRDRQVRVRTVWQNHILRCRIRQFQIHSFQYRRTSTGRPF